MGSVRFDCPMCCNETFNDSRSLKLHLLQVADKLFCPGCSFKAMSIAGLIAHLEACGKEDFQHEPKNEDLNLTDINIHQSDQDEHDILMDDNDAINDDESFLATVSADGTMILEGRTIQVDENGDIQVLEKTISLNEQESSLENRKTLDKVEAKKKNQISVSSNSTEESNVDKQDLESSLPGSPELLDEEDSTLINIQSEDMQLGESGLLEIKKECSQLDEDKEGDVMYSCSTCGVSFTSVLDHIKKFHDGQEVVLEMGDQPVSELDTTPSSETLTSACVVNSPPDTKNNVAKTSSATSKPRQSMHTLRTEECIDSDGRLYTRKVVQIERFWDRIPVSRASTKATPMIEKFFSNVDGLKIRDKSEITVAPTQRYRCNLCLEQFAKITDFRVHVCLQGNNRCDQCDSTYATVKALQLHMKVHDPEFPSQKIFLCTTCGTEFLTHKSLRLHSRMHQPMRARHVDAPEGAEDDTFVCIECGTTLSESYRTAHMALHAGDTITCTICNRKFDSKESLSMHAAVHVENINSSVSSPSIQVSDQSMMVVTTAAGSSTQDGLDSILVTSATLPPLPSTEIPVTVANEATDSNDLQNLKPYQCQHCGRRFTRPHEKVKHERIHTGEKPHVCEVCGKRFRVSYCLTLHMRTHTGVRPYECQHCGKRFKASSVYNHHLLTHGEERAYKCPYCVKTFKTRVQLAGHKNSHTKPFRCTECSRPFASLYAARAHIQTHKKDNNLKFSCNICGASYGRAFALKDHAKQHEKENALVPPEPSREEEVQEIENFFNNDGQVVNDNELIVPSPPPCDPMQTEFEDP